MSKPQSTIYVCADVPLDSRYEHTILFEDIVSQTNYFFTKSVDTFSDYTYLRKTWDIKVSCEYENARTWNYLFFQNEKTSKYYFYFINQIEYENNGTVRLSLELDVIQTYMREIQNGLSRCYIERAHTESDDIGEHTVEENLDTGELRNQYQVDVTQLNDLCLLVYSTFDPMNKIDGKYVNWLSSYYGNVFSGMGIYAVSMEDWLAFGEKLQKFSDDGAIDGVVNMFMYPKALVNLGMKDANTQHTWNDGIVCKYVKDVGILQQTFDKRTYLGSYTPKNKKLCCYPYNFLYVSNNAGTGATYRFERFADGQKPVFWIVGCYSPDGSVKMYPRNYDGVGDNYEAGISLSAFPTCAWNSDMYKVWLAQNQNSNNFAMGSAGLSIGIGAATAAAGLVTANPALMVGGAAGMFSGAQNIASQLAAKEDRQIQPPQARGNHSVSVNVANDKQTFSVYYKCVTEERARIIDDYFTRYGYQINRIGVPNLKARPHFTYIKTVGCHINGLFCNEDRLKAESIFDNGITFWRDPETVCNYELDNSP